MRRCTLAAAVVFGVVYAAAVLNERAGSRTVYAAPTAGVTLAGVIAAVPADATDDDPLTGSPTGGRRG